ncbi:MAG TPA: 4Fe-4S dicluster domain-containing protein [Armatimonadota bacterium]|jgi:ferredoxin
MSLTVNPELLRDIKRYGAFDISACFNCGNCTAVCPLSDGVGSFPRRLIRLGQIGDRERLLSGPEAWLCYYCGECSETCPRQAEPGEYMAAVRRYATAAYEPSGLARLLFRSSAAAVLVTLLLGVVLGAFLAVTKAGRNPGHWLFDGVSYEAIHLIGTAVFLLTTAMLVGGVATALRRMLRAPVPEGAPKPGAAQVLHAAKRVLAEVATMKRHRETTEETDGQPWYRRAAWVHLAIMSGFLGLLLATALDFLFLVLLPLHLKVFWPARVIGTVSGVVMLWGVVTALTRRLGGVEKSVEHSRLPDWWLLFFLLVLAVTGFWLEIVVTLGLASPVNDLILLVHAAMAMELVLLMAFTKMAHVLYRPLSLFVYYLRSPQAS